MSSRSGRPLSVEAVLGPGGALESALPGYEHRPEQLRMAREVERALEDRAYLLAEAGTGTGKTLAYLVPAALSGRKVVISTATKTLQEQIFFKDLPLLEDKVGLAIDAAYLKGRSNYLCLHRFEAFDRAPQFHTREEGAFWPVLRSWAFATTTGDRAELDMPDGFHAWGALSTTADSCLGPKCPLYEPCHVTRARRRAEDASLVVVNHHLFFADLAVRSRGGGGKGSGAGGGGSGAGILPPYDAVIFDEAHALEDAAAEYFGAQVSSYRVEELCKDALGALPSADRRSGMLGAMALQVRGAAEAFFQAAPRAVGLSGEGSVRLTSGSFSPVRGAAAELVDSLATFASSCAGEEEPELGVLSRRSSELAEELDFITRAGSTDHVFWAEARGRGVFLRSCPIDVAQELRRRLYPSVDTLIFTSATLTTEGRFDFFARRMGLAGFGEPGGLGRAGPGLDDEPVWRLDAEPPPIPERTAEPMVRQVSVASPFDYPRQAALYLPRHLPEPSAPGFIEAVSEEIVALCKLTDGRAFALFTSLRNMEAAWQLCRNRLPYPVLLQGERPKTALLDQFRQEPSVLFAAHSFWEGVDVPGDALSLVMIDRLPFASPGDPRVAARIEQLTARGEEPFSGYQLPEAVIALRQGFGRLIRSRQDRGIVAVLDRRLSTKGYGRAFLRSLPPAWRTDQLPALARWLEGGGPRVDREG